MSQKAGDGMWEHQDVGEVQLDPHLGVEWTSHPHLPVPGQASGMFRSWLSLALVPLRIID